MRNNFSTQVVLAALVLETNAWKFRVHHMIAKIAYDILNTEQCRPVLEKATSVLQILHDTDKYGENDIHKKTNVLEDENLGDRSDEEFDFTNW